MKSARQLNLVALLSLALGLKPSKAISSASVALELACLALQSHRLFAASKLSHLGLCYCCWRRDCIVMPCHLLVMPYAERFLFVFCFKFWADSFSLSLKQVQHTNGLQSQEVKGVVGEGRESPPQGHWLQWLHEGAGSKGGYFLSRM